MPFSLFRTFIKLEAASGILLFVAAIIAMLLVNSPLQSTYAFILTKPFIFAANGNQVSVTLQSFVNEGLMTIFFLLVSLEIKRELVEGELNTRAKALLPVLAAVGGMLVPALIYMAINWQHEHYLRGWAIPTTTDIAFSLGILTLLGSRIPISLKIFLTALAIIDDLGAIIIIALFYTDHLVWIYFFFAMGCIFILILCNYFAVNVFWPYAMFGILLWLAIIKTGIHATISGVILGLLIPLSIPHKLPLLKKLEKNLHPWVAFGILPLFAITNAGFSVSDINVFYFLNPMTLGIILGLFIGKQVGVFGVSWLVIKYKIATLPSDANWLQFYGIALICGIGFTMSLFISTLAFPENETQIHLMLKLSVFVASLLSGVAGYLVLRKNYS